MSNLEIEDLNINTLDCTIASEAFKYVLWMYNALILTNDLTRLTDTKWAKDHTLC